MKQRILTFLLALLSVSVWGNAWGETVEISTAEDLYAFAKRVYDGEKTLNASLIKSITVNETLLRPDYVPNMHDDKIWGGNSEEGIGIYKGIFNGNGNTIKGLYIIGKAFIEELEEGGKIINLRIEDSYVKPQNNPLNAAILCGKNKGVIENCYTKSKLIIEGNGNDTPRSYGSICGENFGIIRNCHNEASIDVNLGMGGGGISVGGICGKMAGDEGGENGLLEKCYNKGSMLIKTKRERSDNPINPCIEVGGVVGTVGKVDRNPTQNQTVQYCYNEGEINISSGDDLSHYYPIVAGGIIGYSVSNKNIISCYNTGEIIAHDDITLEKESDMSLVYCALSGIVASGSVKGLEGCYNLGDFTNNVKGENTNASIDLFVTNGNNYSVVKNFYKGNYAAGNMTLSFEGNTINLICENLDNVEGATKITDEILESGEMAWALREYGYGLKLPNENNAYPTLRCFDDVPAVYKLTLHQDANSTKIVYRNSENLNLPEVGENSGWFDINGKEYTNESIIEDDVELWLGKGYKINTEITNGTITIDPNQVLYKAQTSIALTVTPDKGYELKSLECKTVDNNTSVEVKKKDDGTYSFTMPAADVTVSAIFEKIKYKVITNVADEGMGTVSGSGDYAEGDNVTVKATPNEGYEFDSWEVEGVSETNQIGNEVKFKMPSNDVTITAKFKEKEIPGVPVSYNDLYIIKSEGAKLLSRYDKKRTPDGGSFTLSLEKEEGYEDCEPTVYYKRGRFGEWKELKLDEVSGYYQIRSVYTDIYVKVSGDGIWPVSNEEVEAQEVKVYTQNGAIVVSTPSLMDVQVISMTGSVVAADKVAGQREFRNLAEGVYIVRVGDKIVMYQVTS